MKSHTSTGFSDTIKLFLAGLFAVILSLNFSGYCYHQARFLSDEEKIKIVVTYILASYPKPGATYEQLSAGNEMPRWKTVKSRPENPIPYRDMNEFFALNPGCCVVDSYYKTLEGEGVGLSLWDRLMDLNSSIVGVKYLLRYRDGAGVMQSKLIETAPAITSCGYIKGDWL